MDRHADRHLDGAHVEYFRGIANPIGIELTGENVTECTGGARGLTDADLARTYKSTVDPPRLNYEQAMEVAMRIVGLRRHTR